MANKYCDHGLYEGLAGASFTASVSSGTMTVTAVGSGTLKKGMTLTGTGFPDGVYIDSFGTGTGGTGTYNLSHAFTAASTTVTGKFGQPDNVPTWGTAQEGDGTASGAATPAIAEVDFAGITADATDTVTIAGAVLTCVASGAGNNQFNAGVGTALASNLVTAINRTTNTVTVANQGGSESWATPKIQDWCYARIKPGGGANDSIVQIMTRCGSARFNHATNTGVAIATSGLSAAPAITQFIGGAGGAWGVLTNPTILWPSQAAYYGFYGPMGSIQPYAGSQQPGDIVYFRAGKRIHGSTSGVNFAPPSSIGTAASPVRWVIDDGTMVPAWTGDAPNPVLELVFAPGTNVSVVFALGNANIDVYAKQYSSGQRSFVLSQVGSSGGTFVEIGAGSNRIEYMDAVAVNSGARIVQSTTITGRRGVYKGCRTKSPINTAPMFQLQSNSAYEWELIDHEFDATGSASAHTGVFYLNVAEHNGVLINPKFTGFVNGSRFAQATFGTRVNVAVRNPSFGGVTVRGPNICTVANQNATHTYNRSLIITSALAARDFYIETCKGLVEWNSTLNYPTLNAQLIQTNAAWSWRFQPATQADYCTITRPLESPRLSKINSLADGARTVTLEFCLAAALSWNRKDISVIVEYTDVNGNRVSIDTWDKDAAALTASTATWSAQSDGTDGGVAGQVKYSDSGLIFFNKYKFAVATPAGKNMAVNSDVGVYLRVHKTVATAAQYGFVDPDFSIA